MEWLHINTAPVNLEVLIWDKLNSMQWIATKTTFGWVAYKAHLEQDMITHWMPLPAPPKD